MKTCVIDGCGGRTVARGWCRVHYYRWKRTGDPNTILKPHARTVRKVYGGCIIDGCGKQSGRGQIGMCRMHYQRWRRHGDVHANHLNDARPTRPIGERMAEKSVVTDYGCHEWIGVQLPAGYGQIHYQGRHRYAHRVAWEIANGPLPAGLAVHHVCENKSCVNPQHLRAVTPLQHAREHRRAA